MEIICLSGKIRSGKTKVSEFIGEILVENDKKASYYHLGTHLYNVASAITGYPVLMDTSLYELYHNRLEDHDEFMKVINRSLPVRGGKTFGLLLQEMGVNYKKTHGDKYLVNITIDKVAECNHNIAIIDGVRHREDINTIEEFCKRNGHRINTIRIERMNADSATNDGRDISHVSETDLDKWDFDYSISCSFDKVKKRVETILKDIFRW